MPPHEFPLGLSCGFAAAETRSVFGGTKSSKPLKTASEGLRRTNSSLRQLCWFAPPGEKDQQRDHKSVFYVMPASDSTRSRAAFAAIIVVSASRPASGSAASRCAKPAAASSALGVQRCTQRRSTDAFSGRFEMA